MEVGRISRTHKQSKRGTMLYTHLTYISNFNMGEPHRQLTSTGSIIIRRKAQASARTYWFNNLYRQNVSVSYYVYNWSRIYAFLAFFVFVNIVTFIAIDTDR